MTLVQVGQAIWVDPDTIQAITWNDACDCPELLLSGGVHVLAANFVERASAAIPDNEVACTTALLAHLRDAVARIDAADLLQQATP